MWQRAFRMIGQSSKKLITRLLYTRQVQQCTFNQMIVRKKAFVVKGCAHTIVHFLTYQDSDIPSQRAGENAVCSKYAEGETDETKTRPNQSC